LQKREAKTKFAVLSDFLNNKQMKILVVLSRVPYPLEKGDKLRAFHLLKHLSSNNDIVLFCLNDKRIHPDAVKELGSFCRRVEVFNLSKFSIAYGILKAFFKGLPLQTGYFFNAKAKRKLIKLAEQESPDHIFCQLIRTAEYIKGIQKPKTLDYQDVFSKGVERRIAISPWYFKPILQMELKRLVKYEAEVFSLFDSKTIISETDRDLIPHPLKHQIVVIPNGVDTDFFSPSVCEKEYDLLFTGNMSYLPNTLSAELLAGEILPLLHKSVPGINLMIAGANPSAKVAALDSEFVKVSGWVDDIRECYNKSRIFVAPMQIGTGLQNKLLEAMAMGMPCITSDLANNALGAKDGKEIMVCRTNEEYVSAIIKLKSEKEVADRIAAAGRAFVAGKYKWDVQAALLEHTFRNAAD